MSREQHKQGNIGKRRKNFKTYLFHDARTTNVQPTAPISLDEFISTGRTSKEKRGQVQDGRIVQL